MVRSGSLVSLGIGFRSDAGFPELRASGFVGLFLRKSSGGRVRPKCAIERFLEPVVKPEREGLFARFVAGQGEQIVP